MSSKQKAGGDGRWTMDEGRGKRLEAIGERRWTRDEVRGGIKEYWNKEARKPGIIKRWKNEIVE